ncbi:MAG: hypothetical protein ACOYYI_17695 [Chloroflexota bacterium]
MSNLPELYQMAETQAGYFATDQAQQAGFSCPLLTHYLQSGYFLRICRGGYRLAHFPEMPHADLYIAWLSAGKNGNKRQQCSSSSLLLPSN